MTALPAALRRAPAWSRSRDRRDRTGRLAATLLVVSAATVLGTLRFLPERVPTDRLVLLGLAAVGAAGLALVAPWHRMPPRAALVPLVGGLLVLGAGVGAWAGALSHYLLLYAVAALYAGLTLPPRTGLLLAPLTLGTVPLALAGREQAAAAVDLVGAALLSVVVGEVLAAAVSRSETATRGAEALLGAVTTLQDAAGEAEAADLVAGLAAELLAPDVAVVLVAAVPGSPLWVDRGARGVEGLRGTLTVDTSAQSAVALALREGRALFVGDASGSPLLTGTGVERLDVSTLLLVPVPGEGGWLGCLVVGWRTPRRALDPFSEQVVALLSHQAGAVLERLRSVGRLEQQARTDALTGLANRRVFLDALDRLRPGGVVVFLDLDHFKRLNDTQGHAAGDAVLVAFAAALRSSVRDDDCAARYGGEEFALVLPSAASVDMTGAAAVVVERLRRRWDGPVTFSCGIAVHRAGDAPSTTLARADAAVYEAKARGRATTVVAPRDDLQAVPAPRRPAAPTA